MPGQTQRSQTGGLFAWDSVTPFSSVILVEGLFDLAGSLAPMTNLG